MSIYLIVKPSIREAFFWPVKCVTISVISAPKPEELLVTLKYQIKTSTN